MEPIRNRQDTMDGVSVDLRKEPASVNVHRNWQHLCIEVFYNRQRHQARLGHRAPADAYAASKAA